MVVLLVLVTAGVTALSCAPLLAVLRRTGRYDVPNARSSHSAPTPRGGGLAVAAGAVVATAAATTWSAASWGAEGWVALGAVLVLAAVGFSDDLWGLRPMPRLLAQVAIGAGAGAFVGGGLTGAVVGAVVVPAAVNMVNFMDGINGLSGGHAAVWGVGALLAARAGGGDALALLGAISLGGGLGFLPWNTPRARLFLGDVGSYLFGALAGIGLVACLPAVDGSPGEGFKVVALVCAPYVLFALDTSAAIVRRLIAGEPVLRAHRSHVYQRLVNEGELPHWVVSAAMVGTSLVVTAAADLAPPVGVATALLAGSAYLATPRIRHVAVAA